MWLSGREASEMGQEDEGGNRLQPRPTLHVGTLEHPLPSSNHSQGVNTYVCLCAAKFMFLG